jgi:DNA processing protein
LDAPCVTIVGTRKATAYGERVARAVAGELARGGVAVVSGMARGIDGAAHRGALSVGGRTIAVLGTGVDVAYPAAHRLLHRQIMQHGLVLSEELPGAQVSPGVFPKRNRLMAALGSMTIVVEAGRQSGALITATAALELSRTVAAVPGPIDVPQSEGPNELLRDGACVVASVADALVLAGLSRTASREPVFGSAGERAVWEALAAGGMDLDTLSVRAALAPRACMAAVAALELAGAVECALTGEVHRL